MGRWLAAYGAFFLSANIFERYLSYDRGEIVEANR